MSATRSRMSRALSSADRYSVVMSACKAASSACKRFAILERVRWVEERSGYRYCIVITRAEMGWNAEELLAPDQIDETQQRDQYKAQVSSPKSGKFGPIQTYADAALTDTRNSQSVTLSRVSAIGSDDRARIFWNRSAEHAIQCVVVGIHELFEQLRIRASHPDLWIRVSEIGCESSNCSSTDSHFSSWNRIGSLGFPC